MIPPSHDPARPRVGVFTIWRGVHASVAVAVVFIGCTSARENWGIDLTNPAIPEYERSLLESMRAPASLPDRAVSELRSLQSPVPTVPYTPLELREAFLSGFHDGWRFGVVGGLSGRTVIGGAYVLPGPTNKIQQVYREAFRSAMRPGRRAFEVHLAEKYGRLAPPLDAAERKAAEVNPESNTCFRPN